MWWMVAGLSLAGLLGLELRRFWHDRKDAARGVLRYALHAAGHGEQALRLIEIDADGCVRRIDGVGGSAGPHVRPASQADPRDALATCAKPSVRAMILTSPAGLTRLPPPRRQIADSAYSPYPLSIDGAFYAGWRAW
jgi:hypothetical protein